MPFHAHCPSCQAEYELVDSLRGKYVVCERCRGSFRAEAARIQPGAETLVPAELTASPGPRPPIAVPNVSMPSARPASPVKSGAGKSAVSLGTVLIACMLLVKAYTTLTRTSHTNHPPRPNTQAPMPKI